MSDMAFLWWQIKGWLRHLVGTHTLVATETWFKGVGDGGMRVEKTGLKCWHCEYREP